jgi:hypothetical protein
MKNWTHLLSKHTQHTTPMFDGLNFVPLYLQNKKIRLMYNVCGHVLDQDLFLFVLNSAIFEGVASTAQTKYAWKSQYPLIFSYFLYELNDLLFSGPRMIRSANEKTKNLCRVWKPFPASLTVYIKVVNVK